MPSYKSSVWRYPSSAFVSGRVSFSQPSPSDTSITFQAGRAAMRDTSPGEWSYTPVASESDAVVPSGAPTRLNAPLPRKAGVR